MLTYIYLESPVGLLELSFKGNNLCALQKVNHITQPMRKDEITQNALIQLQEYFAGYRKSFSISMETNGTPFQKKVWEALCTIPYGETRSYKQIAEQVGSPKAFRAVGMANHRNPLAIVVPCHRVIGSNGKLIGYAGGTEMKQYLLNLEQSQMKNSNNP